MRQKQQCNNVEYQYLANVQGVPEKPHQIFHLIISEPFNVESRCLHHNARQSLLSTSQHNICVNW